MRFILLEKRLPKVHPDLQKHWETGDKRKREYILDTLIKEYGNPDLNNIKPAIEKSIDDFGIDPEKNEFLNLIGDISFSLTKDHNSQFLNLNKLRHELSLDLSQKHFLNPSLYDRSELDFRRTVRLFHHISNPSTLSKYFIDTTDINAEAFYIEGTDTIKPIGDATGDPAESILATVQSWSKDGENDVSSTSDKYCIKDLLKRYKVSVTDYDNIYKTISNILDKGFENNVISAEEIDNCLYFLKSILLNDKLSVNNSELEQIKDNNSYIALTGESVTGKILDKDKSANTEGNIVWVDFRKMTVNKDNQDDASLYMTPSNELNSFMIYDNGNWVKYSKETINKRKRQLKSLLNTKFLTNISDAKKISKEINNYIEDNEDE